MTNSKATYTKMSQREHILKRPDTYIGGVKIQDENHYIICDDKIINKDIKISPGLLRIFVEIVSNSIDNVWRSKEINVKMSKIKVDINRETGEISVWNDGASILIEMNEQTGVYNPEMIFGQLLTSSNYNDEEKRLTSGRNGLGCKCFSLDTSVPLWNGEIKLAKDVIVGDILIGDDGAKRTVLSLTNGESDMYDVSQTYGETYTVNDEHVLTLCMPRHKNIFWDDSKCEWNVKWWDNGDKCIKSKIFKTYTPECGITLSDNLNRLEYKEGAREKCEEFCNTISDDNTFDISIKEYMALSKTTQSYISGVRGKCVDWEEKSVELDPYMLGLWLGDGAKTAYNKYDTEIIEYIKQYNLINNKHIPKDYIINSRDVRLKVLAGIIDTDGSLDHDGIRISISHKRVIDDVVFLARSLGFCVSVNKKDEKVQSEAYIVNISGNISDIPTLSERKKCNNSKKHNTNGAITISKSKERKFVGFSITGNRRFVINDFTVTHNCTNVFSKSFIVECADPHTKKLYKQEWTDNMSNPSKPKITKYSKANGYTCITFTPDYERFNLTGITDDIFALFQRYIYDTAMITKLNVYLNNEKIPVKSLMDYAKLFCNEELQKELIAHTVQEDDRIIEVVYGSSENNDFEQISFVNGVHTIDGGVHVDAFTTPMAKKISDRFVKMKKQVSPRDVKNHMRVWVNAVIPNPEFNNQSKNKMIAPSVKVDVPTNVFNKMIKWSFVTEIEEMLRSKEIVALKKTEKKGKAFKAIKGYDPANNASKKNSTDCSLILCEGLSAKTFAVTGIDSGINDKKGRNWFGIYALRGCLLNTRNASNDQITNNKEITDVIQILGLKFGVDYSKDENFNTLNYGQVILLADADCDGFHIAGLIMNFFHSLFPTLFKRPGFIINMLTPIISVTEGKNIHRFYSMKEADEYLKKNEGKKNIKVKYLKGLGSSTDKEVKDTFGRTILSYNTNNDTFMDREMNKVFDKKFADERKQWLAEYNPDEWDMVFGDVKDNKAIVKDITVSEYLNNEMIKFSIDDCMRNIPNIYDGLKVSQRKILFAAFLKGRDKLKVSQLAGFVSERTNYHHGEQCLFDTITKMAQDFPGSNNIPLLEKEGQMGTRLQGGKDAASARYIFTRTHNIARKIFREEDEQILDFIYDDGDKVEPKFYLPIIPMILVNGSVAIATGWSTNIPTFNPKDVIEMVENWIDNKCQKSIIPWYRDHLNRIEKVSDTKYESIGEMKKEGKSGKEKYIITELPVNVWTDNYKTFLEKLYEDKQIKNLKNYSTPYKVHFEFENNKEWKKDDDWNLDNLKLKSNINTTNMVVFLENDKLKRMDDIESILDTFCKKRMEMYTIRKGKQLEVLKNKRDVSKNKCRFLKEVIENKLDVFRVKEVDLINRMEKDKYLKIDDSFDYLLNMHMRSFTEEQLLKLQNELDDILKKIKTLNDTETKDIWKNELSELKKYIK